LWVIDLAASPPVLVDTVTVGRQPSGLAISRDGTMALIANRAGKSVSVLSIAGGKVTQTAEVPVGDEVVAVAISPDGRRGFVAKNAAGKIGVLGIDGGRVTYDKAQDMPAGFNPYNLDATADGALVLAANNGIAGNAATLTVIDARATPPRVIDTVTVGDSPEGFAIAPDGRSGVSVLLRGSSLPHAAWAYRRNGSVAAFGIDGRRVTPKGAEVEIGALPEGVAYSRDGSHVYVADYVDRVLHVLRVTADGLADTGTKLDLPGQPASMRGIAH
jgi:DNA-binding beta-propeller fold protein YncE